MSASNLTSQNEIDSAELMGRLSRFVIRSNLVAAVRFLLIGIAAWVGFMLMAMATDTFFEMTADWRWRLGRLSALTAFATVVVYAFRSYRTTSAGQLAHRIDASQTTGGQILTGWDLVRRTRREESQLTSCFVQKAIGQSIQLLSAIQPSSVVPLATLKPPAFATLGLVVAMALIALVSPSLAWTQFKRFAFPASDTPPFSGVVITFEKLKHNLRYGEDIKLIATVSRKTSERLELVTILKDKSEKVLPMLPRGKAKWQALLTDVKESSQFYARSGRTRSDTGEIEVQLTPKILESIVRITPLLYTRQAIYEGKIPDSGIAGLQGTQVELFVTSNRPLTKGQLQIRYEDQSEQRIDLSTHSPESITSESKLSDTVSCQFELDKEGEFDITVTDIDGLRSTDVVQGKIVIQVDQRPVVRILEPRPLSLATPDIDLPISVSAEDDFGITQLRLYRSLNGSVARPIDFPVEESARANVVQQLQLKRYGLVPGDEIELFARTEDNDPNGPKGVESPKTKIRIISIDEFQERMLEQRGAEALAAKYETAQRQLENVSTAIAEAQAAAERAAAEPENAVLQKELQEKIHAAETAAKTAAQAIDKLAQNPTDIDIDRELSAMLSEMAKESMQSAQELNQMAEEQAGSRPLNQSEQESLEKLAASTKSDREQLQEEAIDPLNELNKTLPLMQDKERFDEVVERQKELAERMQSLADADPNDPSNERRMMEMEAAQDELRQELNELAESLLENAEQLPETPEFDPLRESTQQLAEGIKQSGAPELMNDAQKSLLKSKFKQAAENAKAAADSLESLLQDNNSMGNAAGESLKKAFQKPGKPEQSKLGRTLEQLKQRMNQKGKGNGGQGGEQPGEPGGANNGFSSRSPRQQSLGMYGSMPSPSPSSQGRSDKVSQGAATQSGIAKQGTGQSGVNASQSSDAAGQSQQNIPSQYRQRVSDYYRRINELLAPK